MVGAIAVQAFNKAESVIRTLDSIVKCRGSNKYDLFILQDGCAGSKGYVKFTPTDTEKYTEACAKTIAAIESWTADKRHSFKRVRFRYMEQNHGPYKTAEQLIDWAFETSKSVIFSEDDVIFEQDAMGWFERALAHPLFLRPEVWAIAGESKFFDSSRHVPSDAHISNALNVAQTHGLMERFVYFDFIPSSCFATTREKWAEFGKTRGTTNGDRAVVERCRAEGKLCFWPIVARCRDTGMHDPLGYSVRWKGLHHAVFKNSYIVSGMLKSASRDFSELTARKEELLNEFTRSWIH